MDRLLLIRFCVAVVRMFSQQVCFRNRSACVAVGSVLLVVVAAAICSHTTTTAADDPIDSTFQKQIQPLIRKRCFDCHNPDNLKSGVRVDQLTSQPDDRQLFLWKEILTQIADGKMPPKDEDQFTAEERQQIVEWIPRMMSAAAARNVKFNGSARRLTVAQYRNTLRDLLGLTEDVTKILPPDGVSKDGFTNNNQLMGLSPLQVETYFEVAEKALNLCIVDEKTSPTIQNFRVDLGAAINKHPCPDKLILGANSELLNNNDFVVTEVEPSKPFAFKPFHMQTKFNFIEGYVGNDTIREWKSFDSIYHAVFACMRGTPGYPIGEAHQLVPTGLLLRPAIPSPEIFGESNTYGPMANFKISLRELPQSGNFRIKVKAARYRDALIVNINIPTQPVVENQSIVVDSLASNPDAVIKIPEEGIYQVDLYSANGDPSTMLSLEIAGVQVRGKLLPTEQAGPAATPSDERPSSFAVLRLPVGEHRLSARYGDNARLRRLVLNRLAPEQEAAKRFTAFEGRSAWLGVHIGLRRDCGSTLTRVGPPQPVTANTPQEFLFEGAINDYPSPDVEKDNVNYLAGVREIGIRSEYIDGRDLPRLLIQSVEFEGPYYESWPPASHRRIFIETAAGTEPAEYAKQIIESFATRAFRRPAAAEELAPIFAVWQESFTKTQDFTQSVKDALLVVLTSPQFLMLIESSQGPEPEELSPYELASKLSYFLWNTAPDQRLLDLAASKRLHASLDSEVNRMIVDPRFGQFIREFASQWFSLDKFDVVSTDMKRYPRLTRDVKVELRQEPVLFLQHLFVQNRPIKELVEADYILANDIVASYYELGNLSHSGFQFQVLRHDDKHLGGMLTQASILAGLSDGREANPVKRGAWVARKIVAEPPADPPPNVPKLPEDDGKQLTLRQKLEQHRNQEGCAKCHTGIDPWGLPFEEYDAGGRFHATTDSHSQLPDGKQVQDVAALKQYLANDRIDQVTFSVLKHVAIYAAGRNLSYNEFEVLKKKSRELSADDLRAQTLLELIINSDLFLKK